MKKKNNNVLWIVLAVVVAAGIYLYSQGDFKANNSDSAGINVGQGKLGTLLSGLGSGSDNPVWDDSLQKCVPTQKMLQTGGFFECCFDAEKYQVDCKDTAKRLSSAPGTFAIYSRLTPSGGTSNIAYVTQSVILTNAKNVDFTNVWIDNFTWTSSPTNAQGLAELNGKWWTLTTAANGDPLTTSTPVTFQTAPIDLQLLSVNKDTPTTYSATLVTKGTYPSPNGNGTLMTWTNPTNTPLSFRVTKEEIGFTVVVNLG